MGPLTSWFRPDRKAGAVLSGRQLFWRLPDRRAESLSRKAIFAPRFESLPGRIQNSSSSRCSGIHRSAVITLNIGVVNPIEKQLRITAKGKQIQRRTDEFGEETRTSRFLRHPQHPQRRRDVLQLRRRLVEHARGDVRVMGRDKC